MTLFVSILIHLFLGLLIFNFSLQTNSKQILEIGLNQANENQIKNKPPHISRGLRAQSEAESRAKSEQSESAEPTKLTADQNQDTSAQNKSAETDYESYIFQEISSRKSYPALARKLKHSGLILTKISIARDGKVISAKILKTTQSDLLNQEVERLLGSLTEFKKFPENINKDSWDFIIPIEFNLLR